MSSVSESTASGEQDAEQRPPKKKQKGLKRVLMGLLVFVLAVLLAVGGFVGIRLWQMPKNELDAMAPGELSIDSPAVSATKAFGPLKVALSAGRDASVTVTRSDTGQVVWRNDPGKAFLSAGAGSFSTFDSFGYFWAKVNRQARLTEQSITSVATRSNTVTLKGELRGSSNVSAPFAVVLSANPKASGAPALGLAADVGQVAGGEYPTSVLLSSGRDTGEQIHGFGEQYTDYDLPAKVWPVMIGEQGLGRGAQPETLITDLAHWAGGNFSTTYAAWPQYITSENRALTVDQKQGAGSLGVIDLTNPKTVNYELWAPKISVEALAASGPSELITARDSGVNRPPLANWVQDGAVIGIQGGTDKVRTVVKDMQSAGTKVSAVWLQDWVGPRTTSFGKRLWWTWQVDPVTYPGWKQMVTDFNAEGIKVLTYMNTYVVKTTGVSGAPKVRSLYDEGAAKDYLVKNQQGQVYMLDQNGYDAAIVDLTNPKAKDWYANVVAKDVLGAGADGFMADFGEDLPYDAVVANGTANDMHGQWPRLWAETVQQGCKAAGKPECVTWFRSGALGMGEHMPIGWNGDQTVDYDKYDGMASALLGAFAEGVSGVPLTHSDSGGYTSLNLGIKNYVRPPNLNQRWSEMEAFGPMLRTHETNLPQENQQVYSTEQTRAAFARSSQIFAALAPYRKSVTAEAVRTGLPAVRHTSLVFPGTKAAKSDSQLMFGGHVLMAPVFSDSATDVDVAFPPGQWQSIFTGKVYGGDQVTKVPSPLGTPAAFVLVGDPVGVEVKAAIAKAGLASPN